MLPEADLAGSIDLVLYEPATRLHHIVDFKLSDKLRGQMRGYGKMSAPFAHLDDCKGAAYALQTSIYQTILQREYGMRFGKRILLSLHPDAPFVTSVPFLEEEARYLLETRVALRKAREAVARADPAEYACALTDAPLVDAVVLDDGRRVMEKIALVRELPHSVDASRRAAFDAAVDAELAAMPPTEFFAEACVPWRRAVPADGLPPF